MDLKGLYSGSTLAPQRSRGSSCRQGRILNTAARSHRGHARARTGCAAPSLGFEVRQVGLEVGECLLLERRQVLAKPVKERLDEEGDEAHLALGNRHRLSVAIHRDGQPKRALDVALAEKLGHHAVDPRLVDLEQACGVGDVGRLDDELHDEVRLEVGRAVRLEARLELFEELHVGRHVGGEHARDHVPLDLLLVDVWEVDEEVELWPLEQ
mmetsp:Transcript_20585/g.55364  ORF Transcript_20585/g.55364 Transcript_20585/m.55364 type:complete len:211 (+) Transcript_20585:487-1119(+)